ncbi:MAG: VCBS repeat-containing protein [Planctomycetota bacterium]
MLAALLCLAPALPQTDFAPPRDLVLPVQNYRTVRAADLDGDGDLDLAVSGDGKEGVRWHENLGGGAFDTGRSVSCEGVDVYGLDVGDLDGDGDQDIVYGAWRDDVVGWTPNLGQGEFGSAIPLVGGAANSRHVRVLDVDSDGDLDILACKHNSPDVVWFANAGGGSFAPAAVLATGLTSTIYFTIADMDGDGDLDLVAADNVDDSVVLLERSPGGFLPPQVVASGLDDVRRLECADFDGDGLLDVVAVTYGGRTIYTIRALGAGNWAPPVVVQGGIDRLLFARPVDVDGDGDVDLISGSDRSGVRLHRNTGSGTFAVGTSIAAVMDNASNIDIADLDSDGHDDVALTGMGDGMVAVSRGDGTGGFAYGTALNLFGFVSRLQFASDLDGDGDPELVVAGYGGDDPATGNRGLIVVCPNGPSGLQAPHFVVRHAPSIDVKPLIVDVDSDGAPDIVVLDSDNGTNTVSWARNLGGLAFDAPRLVASAPLSGGPFMRMVAGDVDGDGDTDLLSGWRTANGWRSNLGGATGFGPLQPLPLVLGTQTEAYDLSDLDGDGDLDIVRSVQKLNAQGVTGAVLNENLGGGTFAPSVLLWTATDAAEYESADLDGDGDLDFYSRVERGAVLRWREQVNLHQWVTHDLGPTPGGSRNVSLDMDGDGDLDLIASEYATEDALPFENVGGGVFVPAPPFPRLDALLSLASDLDGDGDLDLLSYRGFGVGFTENLHIAAAIGTRDCDPPLPNSTGLPGRLDAEGSRGVSANRLRLTATDLPPQALTLFLASRIQAFVVQPGGSQGQLCLGGAIGRGVGGIVTSGTGTVSVNVDLAAVPQPMGAVAVLPGSTWRFQCWHRDAVGGTATSNFTNSVAVRFD